MKQQHDMPFGAAVLGDGRVTFKLWAPAAGKVELCLEEGLDPLLMQQAGDGWFSLTTGLAAPGTRYRYRIDGGLQVPDPASRFQPDDVHGSSQVVDPGDFNWQDGDWRGRPWEEAVLYELHVGAFTPEGTFAAAVERLDYLVELGVTAIELMPVSDFPGARNWGYDGVLPFAPDSRYGSPQDLKYLIQAAHSKGLMVFLDVVYNHFGPEGNYLHAYAPQFFTERHHTPWGAAINFDGEGSRVVREFFIHNALYWLQEYRFDGLRLDAVHAILDDSEPHILVELADRVKDGPGKGRHVHLVLENDDNAARYLVRDAAGDPRWYVAQWNDDIHHALHVLTTGEESGYYGGYADSPARSLGCCLAEGFAYQGEPSPYRDGAPRGEPSAGLPPAAFISFIQNHDQVGNRAFGERITQPAPPAAVRAAAAVYLLAPSPPMLFMGEEWAASTPFPFFCDFGPDLAPLVTEGRRKEFAKFPEFSDPALRERIPDPNAPETFESAVLRWEESGRPEHGSWLRLYRQLLELRREHIVPRLKGITGRQAEYGVLGERALHVRWTLSGRSSLTLLANMGPETSGGFVRPEGTLIYASSEGLDARLMQGSLPEWSVLWFLEVSSG